MDFKQLLRNSSFCLELRSNTKEGIIEEMVDMMVQAGHIKDRQAALDAVLDRERKMSTGMQDGVAIPHGKTLEVDGVVTAMALKKEGVDFGALDGKPSKIFVMTISSALQTGPYLKYLAEIGKLLSYPGIRDRMLAATSKEEIIQVLTA